MDEKLYTEMLVPSVHSLKFALMAGGKVIGIGFLDLDKSMNNDKLMCAVPAMIPLPNEIPPPLMGSYPEHMPPSILKKRSAFE